MNSPLRTKDIMIMAQIGREALRFYERKGLIPLPKRSLSGYREYSAIVPARIAFIQLAKATGFTLSEIKTFLKVGSDSKVSRDFVTKAIDAKLLVVTEKIKALKKIENTLENLQQKTQDLGNQEITCPLLGEISFTPLRMKSPEKSKSRKAK